MHHDLVLTGPVVTLRPLAVDDAADLAAVTVDSSDVEGDLRWHTSPPPIDERTAHTNIEALVANPAVMALAVVDSVTAELRGVTSFYDLVPAVPRTGSPRSPP
jgi:hypothetical protein